MKKLALAMMLCATPTFGQGVYFFDANELHRYCSSEDAIERSWCTAYVMGVVDGFDNAAIIARNLYFVSDADARGISVCIPIGVERQQVVDVVAKHLKEHPETRHNTAASRARLSLSEAFPCE